MLLVSLLTLSRYAWLVTNVSLAGDHLHEKLLFTWLSLLMSFMTSLCAVLFPTRYLGCGLSQFLRIFVPTLIYCFLCFLQTDCEQPATTGYKVSESTFTGSSVSVECDNAIGYFGAPTPGIITCMITGWDQSSFSGCTLKGKLAFNSLDKLYGYKLVKTVIRECLPFVDLV